MILLIAPNRRWVSPRGCRIFSKRSATISISLLTSFKTMIRKKIRIVQVENSSQALQTKEAARKTSFWLIRKNLLWFKSLEKEWTIQIRSKSFKHVSLANDFLYSCYYIIRSLTSLTWAHRSHIDCHERIWSPQGC
jgi:hypothetical protein